MPQVWLGLRDQAGGGSAARDRAGSRERARARPRCRGNGGTGAGLVPRRRGASLLSWRRPSGVPTPARPYIAPGTLCATCASGSRLAPVPTPAFAVRSMTGASTSLLRLCVPHLRSHLLALRLPRPQHPVQHPGLLSGPWLPPGHGSPRGLVASLSRFSTRASLVPSSVLYAPILACSLHPLPCLHLSSPTASSCKESPPASFSETSPRPSPARTS